MRHMRTDLNQETERFIVQNKSKDRQINDFIKDLQKIEKLSVNFKDNRGTFSKKEILSMQIWLYQYRDYLKDCEKLAKIFSTSPSLNENDCRILLQYVTIFHERKQDLKIDSANIVSQISNLHNILHNLNYHYQKKFQVKENFIEPKILPNKIDNYSSLEEYLSYIKDFFAANINIQQKIEKIKEELDLEEKFQALISEPVLPTSPFKNVNMPPFLEKYQQEYYYQEMLKRKNAATVYEKKLQNELIKIPQDSNMGSIIKKEIKRIRNISEDQYADIYLNLNIPNINMETTSILTYLKLQEPFPKEISSKEYPSLSNKELNIPSFMIDRKKYVPKGKTDESLTKIISKYLKSLGIACALALLITPKDYQKVLGNEFFAEKEIEFDNAINFGDEIVLKEGAVCYETGNILEPNISKISPLYSLDTLREVKSIFLVKGDDVIETHSYAERNYYLELGYKLLSIGVFDGYYKIEDTKLIKKGMNLI